MKNIFYLIIPLLGLSYLSISQNIKKNISLSVLRFDGIYSTYDTNKMNCGESLNNHYKTDSHTEFENLNGDQIFSYGVNKPDGTPLLQGVPMNGRIPYAFKNLKSGLTTSYDNGSDGWVTRYVQIKRVNMAKFYDYKNNVLSSGKYYRFASVFPFGIGKSMHCTIAGSRALFKAGVFNIPFLRLPALLDLQMRVRDYTYLSHFIQY